MMKLKYTDARKIAHLRHMGKPSIRTEEWDARKRGIPRHAVFNNVPSFPIIEKSILTAKTQRESNQLFAIIKNSLGKRKLREKQAFFHLLFQAAKRAIYADGCVRVSRNRNHVPRIHIQTIDAAVEAGFFLEHRSPPGSPRMSRLLPLHPIEEQASIDPWEFDPNELKRFVFLRERNTKEELPVDMSIPIAAEIQSKLELINTVNSRWKITFEPFNWWEEEYEQKRQLRPIHRAIFTDRWDWHGRLYTGKYGHQSLRKIERKTIRFNGEQSVELDYRGMHPRLLYHLQDIPYASDPYALWGVKTTRPMRLLAKQLINAAINAETESATIHACNQSMNTRTVNGTPKTGDAIVNALRFRQAIKETGLCFKEIFHLAKKIHSRISSYFGADSGMFLMKMDSSLAIDILYHFAKRGCPCLSIHDSFIVPESHQQELKRVMIEFYRARFSFLPIVK